MLSTRSRWAPIAGFVAVASANQMAWLTFAPLATATARHFGTSASTVGLLSEVFPLAYVLGAVPAARGLHRSLRGWLAAGTVLSAAGALARLGGTSGGGFAWVMAGQVMVAAAQPLLLNSVVALAQRYLTPQDRPAGISVALAGSFSGFVLAMVTGAFLGPSHIPLLLVLGAAYAVLGAVLLLPALARTPAYPGGHPPPVTLGWATARALWADPVMRRLAYFVFVGFGVFVGLVTWAQPLLAPAGVSTSRVGTLLTLMMLAGVATSAAVPPRVARGGHQLGFLVLAGIVAIAACFLLAASPGTATATVALVVTGLFLLPGMPIMLEVAGRNGTAGAAAGAGALWLAGNAGGIVVTGLVDAVQRTPWLAFTVLGAVIALAAPAAASLRGGQLSRAAGAATELRPAVAGDPPGI